MPDIVSIGPLRVDGNLLAVMLAVAAGLLALSLWIRRSSEARKGPWVDVLLTMALIAIIGWKLGFVISDPSIVWERPSALLIMRGGKTELLIGLGAALIYLLQLLLRRKLVLLQFMAMLPFALLPGIIVWSILSQFPYGWPYALAWILVYTWLWRWSEGDESDEADSGEYAFSLFLQGIGFGGLAASLFASYPLGYLPELTLGLTNGQWLWILMAVVGVLWPSRKTVEPGK